MNPLFPEQVILESYRTAVIRADLTIADFGPLVYSFEGVIINYQEDDDGPVFGIVHFGFSPTQQAGGRLEFKLSTDKSEWEGMVAAEVASWSENWLRNGTNVFELRVRRRGGGRPVSPNHVLVAQNIARVQGMIMAAYNSGKDHNERFFMARLGSRLNALVEMANGELRKLTLLD